MNRIVLAVMLASTWAVGAEAHECGEGRVRGGVLPNGDAMRTYDCALLGRIYCRIAENRAAGLEQEDAARRTADWLADLNRTGSHVKDNWPPITRKAAADVYRAKPRPAGTLFYRAVYSCGVAKRGGDPAASAAFDLAADACEQAHSVEGGGYPNERLRSCLARAVDRIAPVPAKP